MEARVVEELSKYRSNGVPARLFPEPLSFDQILTVWKSPLKTSRSSKNPAWPWAKKNFQKDFCSLVWVAFFNMEINIWKCWCLICMAWKALGSIIFTNVFDSITHHTIFWDGWSEPWVCFQRNTLCTCVWVYSTYLWDGSKTIHQYYGFQSTMSLYHPCCPRRKLVHQEGLLSS